ncbi:uncharacterized protein LOC130798373 [Amaranthus tricolor]|uniref:uncharacterized protein LOC130798373 n=1 Tax=Amaranthus tricolor TaxID=29722 RepID=UPI00258910F2|nr:uncharacterized protein LOC130798373 [Amaranthus tricolor]
MEKPCEVCGDTGWVHAIVICTKCKVTREHRYCMRVMLEHDPENWVCEECVFNHLHLSKLAQRKQPSGSGMRFTLRRPPQDSKVRYISPEEAIGLKSGELRNNSFTPRNAHRSPVRNPLASNIEAIPSSSAPFRYKFKPNPSAVPLGRREPLINSSRRSCLKDKKLSPSTDGPVQQHTEENLTAKCVTFGNLPKSGVSTGTDYDTGAQPKHIGSKGRESSKVTMVFDRYLPNHPAVSPTWKGTFKITGDVHWSFVVHAHPPCKVHRKVYILSKQLPNALQFKMLPRQKSWLDMFDGDVPSELDIGLYFFPSMTSHFDGGGESPRVTYDEQSCCSLLEYLDERDLLLVSYIGEVEIFVLSSKHLQEASQKINKKRFLWGLFRPSEAALRAVDSMRAHAAQCSVSQQNRSDLLQQRLLLDGESMDMDVDMQGGHNVGFVDVVVAKPNRELNGKIEKTLPFTTSILPDSLEFEKQLQERFEKFTAFMKAEEAARECMKVKVKEVDA